MTQPLSPARDHGYTHISDRGLSSGRERQPIFEFGTSEFNDINSNHQESVTITASESESGAIEKYTAAAQTRQSADISAEFEGFIHILDGSVPIRERNTPSKIDREITDQLQRSDWEADLEQALDDFQSVKDRGDRDAEVIEERATELAIEFESAPQEAISLSVLRAVPEFGQHVDTELQNQLKGRLRDLCDPVTYEDEVDNDEPLTWKELAEKRDEFLDEMEPYFERVQKRDTSVEERKRHMLEVFYAYQADNLIIET